MPEQNPGQSDAAAQRYACPKCGSGECLWRGVEVPGWESIGPDLKPLGHNGRLDREVDWSSADKDGTYGCGECHWQGWTRDLLRVGADGKPLPEVDPAQERLIP